VGTDVVELLDLLPQGALERLLGSMGQLPERLIGGLAEAVVQARQLRQRPIRFVQRLQSGVDALDGRAVELDLLANVPVQRARHQALHRLDQPVGEPWRARIHRADGGHLGLGGITGVDQGKQVGQGYSGRARGAFGVPRANAFADPADRLRQLFRLQIGAVVSAGHVSCSRLP